MDIVKNLKEIAEHHEAKEAALRRSLGVRPQPNFGQREELYMHDRFAKACRAGIKAISGKSV